MEAIQIRFEGEGPHLVFVEVEDRTGKSINVGRWETEGEYKLLVLELVTKEDELGVS